MKENEYKNGTSYYEFVYKSKPQFIDEELRNIKHPKLIDYKKEFRNEDIKKLLGQSDA